LGKHKGKAEVNALAENWGENWGPKTLWEGRFKSCVIQSADYLLKCYRYIELNPVRASMVNYPDEYRWSSYHANPKEI
jgi:REP element-mobilizing transposase RayT